MGEEAEEGEGVWVEVLLLVEAVEGPSGWLTVVVVVLMEETVDGEHSTRAGVKAGKSKSMRSSDSASIDSPLLGEISSFVASFATPEGAAETLVTTVAVDRSSAFSAAARS